ncbi:tRNA lysidine(34) synthetase TilS [Shewanella sp. D64]|uniref:tRNA lysidine(34) synthetase TilS n=1 Tax=unclassified Shewanella TaxID=196818 RepID=UPI0022BA6226|nr:MULTISPECIES: tRNA lysidine(34) synthetase TilS [unclassified Shewanella]MEC4727062.1 tRNA lysidine(34) synthetase TilS [Shewanella sp. D64]MEC4737801.1 tRNA lysidine(34) synthetase TilS [Shewanella sp. E94]WBJ93942.1 tRNA lysidine(34) synthetase TilS [Shewanella sp. MTB7]
MAALEFDTAALIDASVNASLIRVGAKLVLAYSGGVDSAILAQGLASYAKLHPEYGYLLIHVHHGLSSNADMWVAHCQRQALHYQLPIEIVRVQVNTGPRLSIEAEARKVRYKAIKSLMDSGDLLLTGHHLDDQLETILLALKRGLGPKGLSAMGAVQSFDGDKVLSRPLLSISREQIEAKAAHLGLQHIEDESNCDDKYDRNFLRLEIIPKLKSRWSAIAATASRSAALCGQQQSVIDEEVSLRLPEFIEMVPYGNGTALNLILFGQQKPNWQALLFRGYVEQLGFAPPSLVQLEQLLNQLLCAKPDAKIELKIGDMLVRRFNNRAYVFSINQEVIDQISTSNIEVDVALLLLMKDGSVTAPNVIKADELVISLSDSKKLIIVKEIVQDRVRMPLANEVLSIRCCVVGSTRCRPHNRQHGRELKKLWQEYGVPPWERARVPLIFYDEKLVCAVGYWIEKSYLCDKDSEGLLFLAS